MPDQTPPQPPAGPTIKKGLHLRGADVPQDRWRWPHFSPEELSCTCGRYCKSEYWHDPAFLDALEKLRAAIGPVHINSARRCLRHNRAVGGARASMHSRSIAADISLNGQDRAKLYRAALAAGFRGFGFARTFLHVDLGIRRRWTYPGGLAPWIRALGFDPLQA